MPSAWRKKVEHLNIGWFEEPVPPEDLAGYRAVKAATSIPMAGGETDYTRFGFAEILKSRAMDYLQPDTCAAGGLSECKKIADMANAFGVRMIPHVWGTGIGLAAALQLLAVLPHNPPSREPLGTDAGVRPLRTPGTAGDPDTADRTTRTVSVEIPHRPGPWGSRSTGTRSHRFTAG